jgi:hypothetical protein
MIKLQASYGLKLPAEQEFSSESFHASAEIEVADSLAGDGLKSALGALWTDLKTAVEDQIAAKAAKGGNPDGSNGHPLVQGNGYAPANGNGHAPVNRMAGNGRSNAEPASKKQIGFLLALARRHKNFSAEQTRQWLKTERGLNLNELSKSDAAGVIDALQGK